MAVQPVVTPQEIDTTTRVVETRDIPFVEMSPGIELKMLRVGGESGVYTLMTRFAPGTVLPRHRHFGPVHAYTIEGRWYYKEYDWVAEAGSFIYEPANSVHTLAVPADNSGPTLVLFTIEAGMVLLGDNDELLLIEDAQSVNRYYAMALEMRGIPYPAGILP